MPPEAFGKVLMLVGGVLFLVGLFVILGPRIGLGRLPGDIHVQSGNMSFFFPIVTCIALSIILTVVLNLFRGR
jgi:hypothetical protein